MTSPGSLGSVEVDVELNIADIGPRLRRALRKPAERVGEEMERMWGRSGDRAGNEYGRGMQAAMRRASRNISSQSARVGDDAAQRVRDALASATRDENLLRIDADVSAARKKIDDLRKQKASVEVDAEIARAQARIRTLTARREVLNLPVQVDGAGEARNHLDVLRDSSDRLGVSLGRVVAAGAKLTLVGAAAGAAGIAVGSLSLSAMGLASALGQAAGVVSLLPAGFAAVGVSVSALVVGFQGMGEALSAVMDEDPEKLAEAMESLTPAAQSAVRAFAGLRPQLAAIREATQENLFAGLDDEIARLDSTYLPSLERGLGKVADGMNSMMESLFDSLADQDNIASFDKIFANTGRAADKLAPAVDSVVSALADLGEVGSSFLPGFADSISDASKRFEEFIANAKETGQLHEYMQGAIDTVQQLGRIIGNVGGTIGNVFGAAEGATGGFLGNLERMTAQMEEWSGSDHGQETLASLFESIQTASEAVMPVLGSVVDVFANDLAPVLAEMATQIGPGVKDFIEGLGEAIKAAGPRLAEFAGSFGDMLATVAPFLSTVGDAVGAVAGVLSTLFDVLRPVIAAFVSFNDALGGAPALLLAAAGGVWALRRAMSGGWAKKWGKDVGNAMSNVGKEVDKGGKRAGKKAETTGDKIGKGLRKGFNVAKGAGWVGVGAAIVDEFVQIEDTVTGQTAGLLEAAAISFGRGWDYFTGQGPPIVEIRGQAQTVVEAYGEEFAKLPPLLQERAREIGAAMDGALGISYGESVRMAANMLAEEYTAGLQNVSIASTAFWANLAMDTQTGTTNVNTAVSGAMQTMNAVMTGGLSLLQTSNRTAWNDIVTMTTSSSLSTSEAVRGAMSTARTVMSGGLAAMVSDTSSSWSKMRSSTRSGGEGVRSAASGVAGQIAGAFGGLPGVMSAVGSDMMAGLRMGIATSAASVALAAGNAVSMAVAAARAAARSHSPSLEMMDLGRDMGAGLAIGLDRSQALVARAGSSLAMSATGGAALEGLPGVHGGTVTASPRTTNNTRTISPTFHVHTATQDPRAVVSLMHARLDGMARGVM